MLSTAFLSFLQQTFADGVKSDNVRLELSAFLFF